MNLIKTNKFRGYLKVWAAPISLLIFLFLFGALGYRLTEGWDWGDCLWMVLITITTIGFGEVEVLSAAGRISNFFNHRRGIICSSINSSKIYTIV